MERELDLNGQRVLVIDAALSGAWIGALYGVAQHVFLPPSSLYLRCAQREEQDDPSSFLPRPLRRFLRWYVSHLADLATTRFGMRGDGFEVWFGLTVAAKSRSAYVHVDNDELLRRVSGVVRSPLLGSILYLGPENGLVGGNTVFLPSSSCRTTDLFVSHDWDGLLARSPAARVVEHRPGRLVLFEGAVPHAVTPTEAIPDASPRAALLANLWDAPIALPDASS